MVTRLCMELWLFNELINEVPGVKTVQEITAQCVNENSNFQPERGSRHCWESCGGSSRVNHLWFLEQGVYVQYVRGGKCHQHAYMHVTNFCGISSTCSMSEWKSWCGCVEKLGFFWGFSWYWNKSVYTDSEAFEHSMSLRDFISMFLSMVKKHDDDDNFVFEKELFFFFFFYFYSIVWEDAHLRESSQWIAVTFWVSTGVCRVKIILHIYKLYSKYVCTYWSHRVQI